MIYFNFFVIMGVFIALKHQASNLTAQPRLPPPPKAQVPKRPKITGIASV